MIGQEHNSPIFLFDKRAIFEFFWDSEDPDRVLASLDVSIIVASLPWISLAGSLLGKPFLL